VRAYSSSLHFHAAVNFISLRRTTRLLAIIAILELPIHAQDVVAWGSNQHGQTAIPPSATNIVAVAAGWYHSVAVRSDGTIVAWGSGAATNTPNGITSAVGAAAGANHSLVQLANGTLISWGDNSFGQTHLPAEASNIIAIASGDYHNLALRSDGKVVAWGRNDQGQCSVPASLSDVVEISAGAQHSVALRSDGSVEVWGASSLWQATYGRSPFLGALRNVLTVAAGGAHNVGLKAGGKVFTWGYTENQPLIPRSATNIVSLAARTNYNLALRSNGGVLAWGAGTVTNVPSSLSNVFAISAGLTHCLAIRGDGSPRVLGRISYRAQEFVGNPLPLFARATGKGVLNYQWIVDEVPIAGADGAAAPMRAQLGKDHAAYRVIVTNLLGRAASGTATVAVRPLNVWGRNEAGQAAPPAAVADPVSIAAGGFHCLALISNGTVIAWGKNQDGQASVPAGTTNIVAIAAGADHSLALRDDGSVMAWGRNWDGQATVPADATNLVAISAGWAHSVALRANGTLLAWGNNTYGQTDLPLLATEVTAISAGHYHNMALRSDRTVATWGWDVPVPAAVTNVVKIAAGWEHCLALRADGTLMAWGDNAFGQSTVPSFATNVVAIAAGWHHNLALRSDGIVVAWGRLRSEAANAPLFAHNISQIAAGEDFSVAIASAGALQFGRQLTSIDANAGSGALLSANLEETPRLTFQWYHDGQSIPGATNRTLWINDAQPFNGGGYILVAANSQTQVSSQPILLNVRTNPTTIAVAGAWGDNSQGQCSISRAVTSPRTVAAGTYHGLALNADGTVAGWGKNRDGQATPPETATNVMAIAAGGDHSLAVRTDGSVIAWGRNWDGQTNIPSEATNIVSVSAGFAHSVALRADGKILAWGNDEYGQCEVPWLATPALAVAAGYYHNLAILSDHTVMAWGLDTAVPSNATNVIAVSGGWWHSLALRADGTIVSWGDNSYGQCDVPLTATNVVGIAAGYHHSLARLANGTVVAWGKGYQGVLSIPKGLGNVISLAAGESFNLAVTATGPPQFRPKAGLVLTGMGGRAVLSAEVEGTQPLSLQWHHHGLPIAGATTRNLVLPSVSSDAAGAYTLIATNAVGQAAEATLNLVLRSEPQITAVPRYQSLLIGKSLCLPAGVAGEEPISCQWRLNGTNLSDSARLSGTTGKIICLNGATVQDGGLYSLVGSNAFAAVTGLVAQVSVSPIIAWGNNAFRQLEIPPELGDLLSVAAGGDHSLALRPDGTVFAWGDNMFGQSTAPHLPGPAIAIAAGESHSLALLSDGRAIAWGGNAYGQASVPALAGRLTAIAAGESHSLALRADGRIIVWGDGRYGQTNVPPGATNIVAIAAGGNSCLALQADGKVFAWGGALTTPPSATNVVALACGSQHALALRSDGVLIAWGKQGQSQAMAPEGLSNIVAISAGGDISMALRVDGLVAAWGADYFGETAGPASAVGVAALSAGGAHSLALLGTTAPRVTFQPRSCSARSDQQVLFSIGAEGAFPLTWQWFHNGELIPGATSSFLLLQHVSRNDAGNYRVVVKNALGETTSQASTLTVEAEPIFVHDTVEQSVLIRLPATFSAVLDGERPMAYQWQFNGTNLTDGPKYSGTTSAALHLIQTVTADSGNYTLVASNAVGVTTGLVARLAVTLVGAWERSPRLSMTPLSATNVVAISAGKSSEPTYIYGLALRADGGVSAWGQSYVNSCWCSWDGTPRPMTLVPSSATNLVAVSAGAYHCLGLRADGTLIAWGYLPEIPTSATNIVAISAGFNHSLALRSDGGLVSWGLEFGGLNDVPPSATNVQAIAEGSGFSMALRTDGTVVAWGYGLPQTNVPAAATNVVSIAAGANYGLALRGDGSVIGWGSQYTPTNIPPSATNVVAISAGDIALALCADGRVLSWEADYPGHIALELPLWATNVQAISSGGDFGMALLKDDSIAGSLPPITQAATLGSSTLLTSGTLGRGQASYQWEFEGRKIPGATNAALALDFVAYTNSGTYRVTVHDWLGVRMGPPINLIVNRSPLILNAWTPVALPPNVGFRLGVSGACGTGPLVVYASTNLTVWEPILTNPPTMGSSQLIDVRAINSTRRFYRVAEAVP